MTYYRIKSRVLKAEGHKYENVDGVAAVKRLAEVQKRDPQAKLLVIKGER